MFTWGNKCKYELILLFMACFCCTSKCSVWENLMVEIKTLKLTSFFLVFVKNSKRLTRHMVFWNRTIISKKDDHESWVLTQICIAYMLILKYIWHGMFDVNIFLNIKTNVPILQYNADIAYTHCKQLTCTVLSSYPSSFCGILEKQRNVIFGKFWNCRRHELADFYVMLWCFSWNLRQYLAYYNDLPS